MARVLDSVTAEIVLDDWKDIARKAIDRGPMVCYKIPAIERPLFTINGVGMSCFIYPHVITSCDVETVARFSEPKTHQTLEMYGHIATSTGIFIGFASDAEVPEDTHVNIIGNIVIYNPDAPAGAPERLQRKCTSFEGNITAKARDLNVSQHAKVYWDTPLVKIYKLNSSPIFLLKVTKYDKIKQF